jgi:hypothetical protein
MSNTAELRNLNNERLIHEGEAAVDLYNKDIKSARTRIMPMARGLLAARHEYPGNADFSDWLQTSSYREVGADDRAALIKIGEHEHLAGEFIRTTSLTSPESIWDAIRKLKALAGIDVSSSELPKIEHESPTLTEPAPIADVEAIPVPEPGAVPATRPLARPAAPAVHKRSAMHGWPRAAEVHAIFTDPRARAVIGHAISERGGKDIWSLILLAIDHGFVTKNDMCLLTVTARILFPASPRTFWGRLNLTDQTKRAHVRDVIMPAAIANRDAILAAPDKIEEILAAHARQQSKAARETIIQRKTIELPSTQCEVVMFDEVLWPAPNNAMYDFDQIRAAVWFFRDINTWLEGSRDGTNVGSRAIIMRLTTKWFSEYAQRALSAQDQAKIRRVFILIDQLTRLLERNPDGKCKWPPTPTAEGQW